MNATSVAKATDTGAAEPHAMISWHTLSLIQSINNEEHLVIDQQKRLDLAALLGDAARAIAGSAQRLSLTPQQAEVLRFLQAKQLNQPTHLN